MVLELLTFLGLALLLEGVVLSLFPDHVRRMMAQFASLGSSQLRTVGLGFSVLAALVLVVLSWVSGGAENGGMVFGFPTTRAVIAGLL